MTLNMTAFSSKGPRWQVAAEELQARSRETARDSTLDENRWDETLPCGRHNFSRGGKTPPMANSSTG